MQKKQIYTGNVNEITLISTVDIGKSINYGYYRCSSGIEIKPFSFRNDREGFRNFWQNIYTGVLKHQASQIKIGYESTGSYSLPFVNYIQEILEKSGDKRFELVQINPSHTKKFKDLSDNSPNKTDKKDPKVIADVIQMGHYLKVVTPRGYASDLRNLTEARQAEQKERISRKNRLEKLVFITFPEYSRVIKKLTCKTSMYLLEHYPGPSALIELGIEDLSSIMKKQSRSHFKRQHAEELLKFAASSIGIKESIRQTSSRISRLISQIRESDKILEEIEKEMDSLLEKIPYGKNILSIKGIGVITASYIISEVGDFSLFPNHKTVIKYAGLNLFEVSSGQHKGLKRISKRGRSLLRKILYFASLQMVRKGGVYHTYYQEKVNKGMQKIKALIAVCRKLLKLIFALVRDNTNYIQNYSLLKTAA